MIPLKRIPFSDQTEGLPEPKGEDRSPRRRPQPGVVILDSSGNIHFLNPIAKKLLSLFERKEEAGPPNALSLPSILFESYMQSKNTTRKNPAAASDIPSLSRYEMCDGVPYLLRSIFLEAAEAPSDRRYLMVLIEALPPPEPTAPGRSISLSRQEQRVVLLLSKGKRNKTIALAMGLSDYTVKEYIKRIMRKLNVTTRSGIVAKSLV